MYRGVTGRSLSCANSAFEGGAILRRVILVGLIAAACLLVAAPAWAKGVSRASIVGPGQTEPILIEETAAGGNLSPFVQASGFWQLLYGSEGPTGDGALLSEPPAGDLGPVYRVTWYLGDDPYPAESEVYPLAPGGPLVHVEEGKPGGYFGINTVPGGWFAADPILLELMAEYSVPVAIGGSSDVPSVKPVPESGALVAEARPVSAISATASPAWQQPAIPAMAFVIVGIGLVGSGVWAMRRRPRRFGAP